MKAHTPAYTHNTQRLTQLYCSQQQTTSYAQTEILKKHNDTDQHTREQTDVDAIACPDERVVDEPLRGLFDAEKTPALTHNAMLFCLCSTRTRLCCFARACRFIVLRWFQRSRWWLGVKSKISNVFYVFGHFHARLIVKKWKKDWEINTTIRLGFKSCTQILKLLSVYRKREYFVKFRFVQKSQNSTVLQVINE